MADVLLIDQRDVERDCLGGAIAEYGHDIHHATPEDDHALALADRVRLIVVLLRSREAAINYIRTLRGRAQTQLTPIVACTFGAAGDGAEDVYQAGATNVHELPLFPGVVAASCHQLLQHDRLLCAQEGNQSAAAASTETPGAHHATPAARIAHHLALTLDLEPAEARHFATAAAGRNHGLVDESAPEPAATEERAAAAWRGYEFWKGVDQLAAIAALRFREHWDGTGVPHGLQGHAIPLVARVTAIADCYERLTCGRQPLSAKAAVRNIQALGGTELDPTLAKRLGEILEDDALERVVDLGRARR